jgi:hypothetical protein
LTRLETRMDSSRKIRGDRASASQYSQATGRFLHAGNAANCERGCGPGSWSRGRRRHSIDGKTHERPFSLSRVNRLGEEERLQKRINPPELTVPPSTIRKD